MPNDSIKKKKQSLIKQAAARSKRQKNAACVAFFNQRSERPSQRATDTVRNNNECDGLASLETSSRVQDTLEQQEKTRKRKAESR